MYIGRAIENSILLGTLKKKDLKFDLILNESGISLAWLGVRYLIKRISFFDIIYLKFIYKNLIKLYKYHYMTIILNKCFHD